MVKHPGFLPVPIPKTYALANIWGGGQYEGGLLASALALALL
jgi:hypothetical protein